MAGEEEIPPEGIGKGIRHISYSDIGGRPDSVQVMAKEPSGPGSIFSQPAMSSEASGPH